MKKIIAVALCGIFLLTGCDNENIDPVEIKNTAFHLVSDPDTGIIYIKNRTYYSYCVYTPYYSENGKLCRYDDGRIVEIQESEDKE